jgi:hypothetical protein
VSLAGDLDLVVGDQDGLLHYIENTGTSTAPVFVQRTGSANPFDGIDVGWDSKPALGDLDGDGTLIDAIDAGWRTAPALGDIDGDGTLRPRPSIDML